MKLEAPLRLLDPPDPAAWDALVASAEGASVFHTSAWAALWTETWRDAAWRAIVLEEEGTIQAAIGAIVRRRGLFQSVDAMPFATYGGPIVRRGHRDPSGARAALLEAFGGWVSSRRVLRWQLAWLGGSAAELPERLPRAEEFTHVLALAPTFDDLAERFTPSTRRLIRQAEESGLAIRPIAAEADLRAFYDMAVETVRRRGGTPKPYSLYERIFERLVPAGLARYHLVTHGDAAVAASLHLFREGVATNWLPVSRSSSWPLRPNNFLIANVLASLCDAGYVEYNFGASPPDALGLIRFKEGWGATRRPVLVAANRSALHRRLRP
ncbi:MAG TPA: GNAT family N-acetyltransferase [Candidatus Eisenbacteria bacterium]